MQHLQLQRILNFNVDDLRANREGKISEAQHDKHKPPEVSKLALYVIFGHAIVIVGLLGAIAIISARPAMWVVVGVVLALGLLPFLIMNNEGNLNPTLRGDVQKGRVEKVCGIAFITQNKDRNNISSYELYIDGMTFKVTSSQASAFIHEQDYCIYYLPLSKTLLSAEPYRGD
ncbi:MAG: hypothetical protein WBC91_09520 [Phototrophicaceae bacterium]